MPQPKNMSMDEYRRLLGRTKVGASWRLQAAHPTTFKGLKFPSKIQALVYQALTSDPKATQIVIREPIIDLWNLAVKGVPGRWRPDFLVLGFGVTLTAPSRHISVPGAGLVSVAGPTSIEIHEAKGSAAAESRDWKLRARAFLAEYPFVDSYCWRYIAKKPRRFPLDETVS